MLTRSIAMMENSPEKEVLLHMGALNELFAVFFKYFFEMGNREEIDLKSEKMWLTATILEVKFAQKSRWAHHKSHQNPLLGD